MLSDIRSMSRLLNFIEKKGTALTIPYSGKPERPRRSNYPFNGGFVSQKTLVIKCANAVFVFLLTYIIHIFYKKSTGKIDKIFSHIPCEICWFLSYKHNINFKYQPSDILRTLTLYQ